MKNVKTRGLLLGLGVLGVTALASNLQPAQAAPQDVIIAHPPPMHASPYVRKYRVRPVVRPYQTLTGSVIRDFPGADLQIMNRRGVTTRVTILGGQPYNMNVGDRIQVSGYYSYGVFRAVRWVILVNR